MYLKILIFLFLLLYQNVSYSKVNETNDFNQKYLSNYFSALVSFDNQKNEFVKRYIAKTPLSRMGNVKDLTGPVLFLASKEKHDPTWFYAQT